MEGSEMKTCIKCKEEKQLNEFNKRKGSKDGLDNTCRKCAADRCKQWREKNAEKHAETVRLWKKNNPEKVKAIKKKYRDNNREKLRAKGRQYARRNREKIAAYCRKYREANPEKVREMQDRWRLSNPEKVTIIQVRTTLRRTNTPITAENMELAIMRVKLKRVIKQLEK